MSSIKVFLVVNNMINNYTYDWLMYPRRQEGKNGKKLRLKMMSGIVRLESNVNCIQEVDERRWVGNEQLRRYNLQNSISEVGSNGITEEG